MNRNRIKEILEIIFSLPEEEREEVERGIKERKKEMRGIKSKASEASWLEKIYYRRGQSFHTLEELRRMKERMRAEKAYKNLPGLKKEVEERQRRREK